MRFFRTFLASLALAALLFPDLAGAQVQVQQTPTRIDSSSTLCSIASAVNATQATGTCTITPPNGQSVYITGLYVANCIDGTASTSSVQQNFTTTNLGGLVIETSIINFAATTATATPGVSCDRQLLTFTTPLKSAAAGTAVTIVPPAQAAHGSFPITVFGYFNN